MNTTLKRSLSGIVFLSVLIGGILYSPYSFAGVFAVVLVCSTWEYFSLMTGSRFLKEKICVLVAELLAFAGCFWYCQISQECGLTMLCTSVLPLVAGFIFLLLDSGEGHEFDASLFFPVVYILLPVCFALWLCYGYRPYEYEPMLLLSMFILAWVNDTFAYVFGMSFGQKEGSRKLAPKISPKKSWVGVAGGTAATFIAALVIWFFYGFGFFRFQHWLALAAIVSVFGVFGDLFESLIKRHACVKDAGNAIPGHGGFLDRFDDIFFIIPMTTIYLILVSIL